MTHHTGSDEGRLSEVEREQIEAWHRVEGHTMWLEAETAIAAVERILAARAAAPDALRGRVEALAINDCTGCFDADHECGDPVCALKSDLRAALADTDGATT